MEAVLSHGVFHAGENLARIGPAAVPVLIKALRNEDPDVRQNAAWGLRYLGPDGREAVPALAELVKKDEKACNFAVQALGQIGPAAAPAVPALVAVLQEGDQQLQYWVLDTLREIGPGAKEAKNAVVKALNTDDAEQRWEAAAALMAMGEVDAGLPVVLDGLCGDNMYYSIGGVELVIAAGSTAAKSAPTLAEVMHNEKADAYLRVMCAKALTVVAPNDDRGIVFLRQLATRPNEPSCFAAASTLVESGRADATVVSTLKEWLTTSKDPRTVVAVAGVLAQVESERDAAKRLLQERLQAKDPEVRVSAALALAHAGVADPAAVKILTGELRKEDGSGRVMEAIRALGKIIRESTDARAAIEEVLHAESEAVHAAARAAMNGDQK
jgi:HEAT repeat protein